MRKNKKVTKRFITALIAMTVALFFGCGTKEEEKFTVVLDAGHDIDQVGYQGVINEYDYTSALTQQIQTLFEKDRDVVVHLSHPLDQPASIQTRMETINEIKPDLVVSIHAYMTVPHEPQKKRILLPKPNHKKYKESLSFGTMMQSQFEANEFEMGTLYFIPQRNDVYSLHFEDVSSSEVKEEETMPILEECSYPIIVVEGIDVTKEEDTSQVMSEEGMQALAQKYYDAITEYKKEVK